MFMLKVYDIKRVYRKKPRRMILTDIFVVTHISDLEDYEELLKKPNRTIVIEKLEPTSVGGVWHVKMHK